MLVTPEGVRRADIGVEGGKIVRLEPEVMGAAAQELDARGLHAFPGLIDAHVHFNEPGRAEWEGVASGSAALLAGGGTVFFDMPLNSHPPLLTAKDFQAKRRAAEALSLTDFALWGGLTPDNLGRLDELADLGVIGFKAFMCNSGIPEFRAADDYTLYEGMRRAAQLGLPVAVHAENDALTAGLAARRSDGSVRAYLASRPVLAELEAVSRACLYALETGCKLHLVHLSSGAGVRLAAEARAKGADVSLETCPHYLHFTGEDMERLGAMLKCAPPLRSSAVRDELWDALLTGWVDTIGSDHSPSSPDLKDNSDFFEVWGGVSGVQTTLSVLLTHAEARGLSLERVAELTSSAPAERFNLKDKGRLAVGCDADLALVDLEASFRLEPADLLTRHKQSPYLGERLRGRVRQTLLRGQTLYQDGAVLSGPAGKLLRPQGLKT